MQALVLNRRNFLTGAAAMAAATPLMIATTGCNTDWIATALKDIPTLASIVEALASVALQATGNGLLTPAANTVINAAATAATTGLNNLQTIITDLNQQKITHPSATVIQKIELILNDVNNSLASILSTFSIKDSGLIQTISTGVAIAISTLSSISLLIPASSTPGPASAKKASKQKTLMMSLKLGDNETLASMFNAVAVNNGYAAHQVTVK